MERTVSSGKQQEDFTYEDISTLHLLSVEISDLLGKYKLTPTINHISTALATYASKTESRFIAFLSDRVMHVCVMDEHGDFLMYNQYKSFYDEDLLYFLRLVYTEFFPKEDVAIHLCGNVLESGEVWRLLRRYFKDIKFIDGAIKLSEGQPEIAPAFYDLHLCRQCVS